MAKRRRGTPKGDKVPERGFPTFKGVRKISAVMDRIRKEVKGRGALEVARILIEEYFPSLSHVPLCALDCEAEHQPIHFETRHGYTEMTHLAVGFRKNHYEARNKESTADTMMLQFAHDPCFKPASGRASSAHVFKGACTMEIDERFLTDGPLEEQVLLTLHELVHFGEFTRPGCRPRVRYSEAEHLDSFFDAQEALRKHAGAIIVCRQPAVWLTKLLAEKV